ncbi:MAG: hypothetical protein QOF76_2964 [Solirubrobacteraceae bacterium]|jgi:hypothetical protein|nr:hypothetical protein [Solirubrobacteraceae bacterium]
MRTTVLPAAMVLVGIAMLVRTIAVGGGAGAIGIIMGVLFLAAGGGRLWIEHR